MLEDISYHKATLQSEGKHSIHIHIHMRWFSVYCRTQFVVIAAYQTVKYRES